MADWERFGPLAWFRGVGKAIWLGEMGSVGKGGELGHSLLPIPHVSSLQIPHAPIKLLGADLCCDLSSKSCPELCCLLPAASGLPQVAVGAHSLEGAPACANGSGCCCAHLHTQPHHAAATDGGWGAQGMRSWCKVYNQVPAGSRVPRGRRRAASPAETEPPS